MKPFRFGINARDARSRAEWQDKARKIEALGYSTLMVPDHLWPVLAPIPALVSAAAATTTLRVGTNVINNDLRHPVVLAREAATVDLLTDGRLELGLGAGYVRSEYDQAGLRFDRGGVRVERLAESLTIVKELLRGAEVNFAGQHYRVTGHKIHPLPIQRPHPPIMIGGNGPRLLTLAAKEADTVNFTGITFARGGTEHDMSAWKVPAIDERMRLVREAAGERFDSLEGHRDGQPATDRRGAGQNLAAAHRRGDPREPLRVDRNPGRDGRSAPRPPRALGPLLLRHL